MSILYVNCTSGQYLNGRSAPSTSAAISYYIPQGERVTVLATSGNWKQIKVEDYYSQGSAWVMTSFLTSSDPGRIHNTRVKAFGNRNQSTGYFGRYTKNLQLALGITVDGVFGPVTEAAVISYQTINKLKVDGIAGTQTLTKLWSDAGSLIISNGF